MHERGGGFGPPTDRLDAEVVVRLDTEPGKAFSFRLRADDDERKARGQLDLLRDAFRHGIDSGWSTSGPAAVLGRSSGW
jgi:hypothetical protein